ncbi:MAG: V-type ATP synthase subunit B [archaeon]
MIKEYCNVRSVEGPLLFVEGVSGVGYGEIVEVETSSGVLKRGKILEISENIACVQIFESTMGLDTKGTRVRFFGETFKVALSLDMVGRVFDGAGRPISGPKVVAEVKEDVNGRSLNPTARESPKDFIQTGVSAIDGMNSLVMGQKLPIFSGAGLPHNELAAQIARQAVVKGEGNEDVKFCVVFCAMGITFEEADFFVRNFDESGAIENVVMFLNLSDSPAIERLITPRVALTTAEFLAYKHDYHVLVILTDMTNYCEALREVSASRNEVPGRRGSPGYMYTDLASIYERAGRVKGAKGTITQIPILTMPNDDITHPVADLTGYITEGQIVLNRKMHQAGITPPINVLPSLSRLMGNGIGAGKTREDHHSVSNQLYSAYSEGKDIREIVSVIGEESLSDVDYKYLTFAREFEEKFLCQKSSENRTIDDTLDIGWKLFSGLPKSELKRIPDEIVAKHLKESKEGARE